MGDDVGRRQHPAQDSYARRVRAAMNLKGIDTKELAKLTGYAYEHLRKVYAGHPSVSENCNAVLCKELGLDTEAMWEVALREKLKRQYRGSASLDRLIVPDNLRMKKVWAQLTPDQQTKLAVIAEGLVAERTVHGEPLTREAIAAQMQDLTRQLASLPKAKKRAAR